ncbi:SagB/ThcOx family dehydrogenase [Pseudomonas sp. GD03651]|uniref:microcin B17 processing protein McbC n=1 Tax=Pseudomonas TaxID=286 RepID=UPI0009B7D356|nr:MULTISPECIES: microcin B17 processing protein McbC [Pseudomonas]MBH3473536.1 SagB/ThcOx family dehydrogenase [Pseudomonas putida]MDH2184962.1 SagB/ThcOx family dehydrogenase [Pseudomonas sp. GD03651]HDS1815284.1 SagB/ThcOx family dehydrogenase [Pseudomonas putida]HDS3812465.1 SagB/ThcOx family dehydrogenase [Pseudomonas putida]
MSISHDEYLKFITPEVMDETLAFHAKGNYTIHKATQHLSTLHYIPPKTLEKLTGNELILNSILATNKIEGPTLTPLADTHPLRRNSSCERFESRPLHFRTIQALLAPLLTKSPTTYKRGYPSGGALYPIEVFCINLNNKIEQWPTESDALHLLPSSRSLEAHSPSIDIRQLTEAIIPENIDIGSPSLALIYLIYLPKALFKYRYRGYRLSLMEVGSMYMITDLNCKELQLNSRPWSGYTDHQITKNLRLNPTLFLPACIQLIG